MDRSITGCQLPRVPDGAGNGIAEDSGEPFRLEQINKAFQEKRGENYENC